MQDDILGHEFYFDLKLRDFIQVCKYIIIIKAIRIAKVIRIKIGIEINW